MAITIDERTLPWAESTLCTDPRRYMEEMDSKLVSILNSCGCTVEESSVEIPEDEYDEFTENLAGYLVRLRRLRRSVAGGDGDCIAQVVPDAVLFGWFTMTLSTSDYISTGIKIRENAGRPRGLDQDGEEWVTATFEDELLRAQDGQWVHRYRADAIRKTLRRWSEHQPEHECPVDFDAIKKRVATIRRPKTPG